MLTINNLRTHDAELVLKQRRSRSPPNFSAKNLSTNMMMKTTTPDTSTSTVVKRHSQSEEKDSAYTTPTNSSSSDGSNGIMTSNHPTNSVTANIRKCYKLFGEYSASQPWDVLVTALFVTLVSLVSSSYWHNKVSKNKSNEHCSGHIDDERDEDEDARKKAIETMTLFGCIIVSLLHLAYRLKKIHRIDSPLIFTISIAYLIVTTALFAIIVWVIGMSFRTGWFMIPLLVDMQKVTRMAQFALSSSNNRRIGENIAHGMYVLGPTLSFDSLGKFLLFGLGWHTGIQEFGTYAMYASASVIANLVVYLIYYPVGLAIFLDLTFVDGRPTWDVRQIINTLPGEEGQSPVVHRIKVLAIAFLFMFHFACMPNFIITSEMFSDSGLGLLWMNSEKIFLISMVLLVFIRFFFYEDMDEARELRKTYIEELTRKFAEDNTGDSAPSRTNNDEVILTKSNHQNRNDDSGSESAWSEVGFSVPEVKDQAAQTVENLENNGSSNDDEEEDEVDFGEKNPDGPRTIEECRSIVVSGLGAQSLTDEEILLLVEQKVIRVHSLESSLGKNYLRGVKLRRRYIEKQSKSRLQGLPFRNYDYEKVMGACCECVIGYMPMPVGVAGPLKLDGHFFNVPMATTEGCLVASVNRGCSALRHCGVTSQVTADGMSRGPIVRFESINKMAEAKAWMEEPENFALLKEQFDSTSRFARLQKIKPRPAGRDLFIRFVATTGDAMGMNMLSKGTECALSFLKNNVFPDMEIISLSGNFCTDKKPAAVNWLDGRGKSVTCEAVVPSTVVRSTLKTTPQALVDLNRSKNLVGSAVSGSIGGFNAQAANVVTAIFIATGQDAAQNISSSNCLTQMEVRGETGDLYISVTMPSIEVGTVGGGTILDAQATCLDLLGVRGSHSRRPGENSTQLARIVCATVLAGELSLMSALAAGHLVSSHLRHNRSSLNMAAECQMKSCNRSEVGNIPRSVVNNHLTAALQQRGDVEEKKL